MEGQLNSKGFPSSGDQLGIIHDKMEAEKELDHSLTKDEQLTVGQNSSFVKENGVESINSGLKASLNELGTPDISLSVTLPPTSNITNSHADASEMSLNFSLLDGREMCDDSSIVENQVDPTGRKSADIDPSRKSSVSDNCVAPKMSHSINGVEMTDMTLNFSMLEANMTPDSISENKEGTNDKVEAEKELDHSLTEDVQLTVGQNSSFVKENAVECINSEHKANLKELGTPDISLSVTLPATSNITIGHADTSEMSLNFSLLEGREICDDSSFVENQVDQNGCKSADIDPSRKSSVSDNSDAPKLSHSIIGVEMTDMTLNFSMMEANMTPDSISENKVGTNDKIEAEKELDHSLTKDVQLTEGQNSSFVKENGVESINSELKASLNELGTPDISLSVTLPPTSNITNSHAGTSEMSLNFSLLDGREMCDDSSIVENQVDPNGSKSADIDPCRKSSVSDNSDAPKLSHSVNGVEMTDMTLKFSMMEANMTPDSISENKVGTNDKMEAEKELDHSLTKDVLLTVGQDSSFVKGNGVESINSELKASLNELETPDICPSVTLPATSNITIGHADSSEMSLNFSLLEGREMCDDSSIVENQVDPNGCKSADIDPSRKSSVSDNSDAPKLSHSINGVEMTDMTLNFSMLEANSTPDSISENKEGTNATVASNIRIIITSPQSLSNSLIEDEDKDAPENNRTQLSEMGDMSFNLTLFEAVEEMCEETPIKNLAANCSEIPDNTLKAAVSDAKLNSDSSLINEAANDVHQSPLKVFEATENDLSADSLTKNVEMKGSEENAIPKTDDGVFRLPFPVAKVAESNEENSVGQSIISHEVVNSGSLNETPPAKLRQKLQKAEDLSRKLDCELEELSKFTRYEVQILKSEKMAMSELREDNLILRDKCETAERNFNVLREQFNYLKAENNLTIDRQKSEIDKLQILNQELTEQTSQKDEKIQELSDLVSSIQKSLENKENEVMMHKKNNIWVEDLLLQAQNNSKIVKVELGQKDDLIREQLESLTLLKNEVESKTLEIENLRQSINNDENQQDLFESVSSLKETIAKNQAEIDCLKKQLLEQQNIFLQSNNDLEALKADLNKKEDFIQDHLKSLSILRLEVESKSEEIEKLQDSNKNIVEENNALLGSIESKDIEIKELIEKRKEIFDEDQKRLDSIKSLEKTIESKEIELKELNENLMLQMCDVENKTLEIENLRQSLNNDENQEDMFESVSSLKETIGKNEAEIDCLKTQLLEQQNLFSQSNNDLEALKTDLNQKEDFIQDHLKTLSILRLEVESKSEEIEKLQDSNKKIVEENNALLGSIESKDIEIKELIEKRKEILDEDQKRLDSIKSLEKTIESKEIELKELNENLMLKMSENEELIKQLSFKPKVCNPDMTLKPNMNDLTLCLSVCESPNKADHTIEEKPTDLLKLDNSVMVDHKPDNTMFESSLFIEENPMDYTTKLYAGETSVLDPFKSVVVNKSFNEIVDNESEHDSEFGTPLAIRLVEEEIEANEMKKVLDFQSDDNLDHYVFEIHELLQRVVEREEYLDKSSFGTFELLKNICDKCLIDQVDDLKFKIGNLTEIETCFNSIKDLFLLNGFGINDNKDVEDKINYLMTENSNLQLNLKCHKEKLELTEGKYEELLTDCKETGNSLELHKEFQDCSNRLISRLGNLLGIFGSWDSSVFLLEAILEKVIQTKDSLCERPDQDLFSVMNDISHKLNDLQMKYNQLETKNKDNWVKFNDILTRVKGIKELHNHMESSLSELREFGSDKLKEVKSTLAHFITHQGDHHNCEELKTTITQLESELSSLQVENGLIKKSLDELNNCNGNEVELENLMKIKEEKEQECEALKISVESLESQLNSVKMENEEIKKSLKELKNLKQTKDDKEQECEVLKISLETLDSQLNSLKVENEQINKSLKEFENLKQAKEDKEQECEVLKNSLKSLEIELSCVQTEKERVGKLFEELNVEKDVENKQECQNFKTTLESLQSELSSAKMENVAIKKSLEELEFVDIEDCFESVKPIKVIIDSHNNGMKAVLSILNSDLETRPHLAWDLVANKVQSLQEKLIHSFHDESYSRIKQLEKDLEESESFKKNFANELHALQPHCRVFDLMKLPLLELHGKMLSTIMEKEQHIIEDITKQYEEKLSQSSDKLHQLQEEEKRRSVWIKELEEENEKLSTECLQIKTEFSELKSEFKDKNEAIQKIEESHREEITRLNNRYMLEESVVITQKAQTTCICEQFKALQESFTDLNTKLTETTNLCDTFKEKIDESERKIQALNVELESKMAEIETLNNQIKLANNTYNNLDSQYLKVVEDNNSLKQDLATLKQQLDHSDDQNLMEKLVEKENECLKLVGEQKILVEETERLRNIINSDELNRLQCIIDDINSKYNESENTKNELQSKYDQETSKLKKSISNLELSINELNLELKVEKFNHLETLKEKNEALRTLQNRPNREEEVVQLKKRLKSLEVENGDVNKKMIELVILKKNLLDDLRSKSLLINDLTKDLKRVSEESKALSQVQALLQCSTSDEALSQIKAKLTLCKELSNDLKRIELIHSEESKALSQVRALLQCSTVDEALSQIKAKLTLCNELSNDLKRIELIHSEESKALSQVRALLQCSTIDEALSQIKAKLSLCKELSDQLDEEKDMVKQLDDENEILYKNIQDLEKDLNEKISENCDCNKKLEELEDKNRRLEESLEKKEDNWNKLKNIVKFESLEEALFQITNQIGLCNELKTQLAEAKGSVKQLDEENETLLTDIKQLEKDLNEKITELCDKDARLEKCLNFETELANASLRLKEVELKLKSEIAEKDQLISVNNKLHLEIRSCENKFRRYDEKIKSYAGEQERLLSEIKSLEGEVATYEEKVKTDLKNFEDVSSELKQEREKYENEKKRAKSLEEELNKCKEQNANQEGFQNKPEKPLMELQERDQNCGEFKEENQKLRLKYLLKLEKISSMEAEFDKLKDALASKNELIHRYKNAVSEKNGELQELKSKLERAQTAPSDDTTSLKSKIQELQENLKSITNDKTILKKLATRRLTKLREYEEELRKLGRHPSNNPTGPSNPSKSNAS